MLETKKGPEWGIWAPRVSCVAGLGQEIKKTEAPTPPFHLQKKKKAYLKNSCQSCLSMKGLFHHLLVGNEPPVTSFNNLPFVPGNVCLGITPDRLKSLEFLSKAGCI